MKSADKDLTKIKREKPDPVDRESLFFAFADHFLQTMQTFDDSNTARSEIEEVSGRDVWQVFHRMPRRDARIASNMRTRINGVKTLDYNLVPYDDSQESLRALEVVRPLFYDNRTYPATDKLLTNLMYGEMYGTVYVEVIWDYNTDGYIVPVDYKRIHGKRYDIANNPYRYMLKDENQPIEIPPYKILVQHGDIAPEENWGIGILHRAFWAYFLKKNVLVFWSLYNEKFGMPTVMGKYRGNASEAQRADYLRMCRSIQRDSAVVLPENVDVGLMEASRASGAEYQNLIKYCDSEHNQNFLGQSLATEQGDTGSYAQAKVHNAVRHEYKVSDWLRIYPNLQAVVDWITEINFGSSLHAPIIEADLGEKEDRKILLEAIEKAQGVGMEISRKEAYDRLGFSQPADDDDVLTPKSPPRDLPFSEKVPDDGETFEETINELAENAAKYFQRVMNE